MPNKPLEPADRSDVLFSLAFALTNKGKRRFDEGRSYMARITAEHLLAHLELLGDIIMQGPSATMASWPPMPPHAED